jgi:hypothetical protein
LNSNTNGIPMVIGAKKGFPNFNEFTLRTDFLVSRKVQLTRPNTPAGTRAGTFPNGTNQMYVLGISNYFGAEAWNSYDVDRSGPYPRDLKITVSNHTTMWLSNGIGFQNTQLLNSAAQTNVLARTWRGGDLGPAFILAMNTNQVFLSNAVYVFGNNTFANVSTNSFEPTPGFPLPYWIFGISNRLTYVMSELAGGYERILDFVLLQDNHTVDLYRDLIGGTPYSTLSGSTVGSTATLKSLWDTNRIRGANGPPEGIVQQVLASFGELPLSATDWAEFSPTSVPTDKDASILGFRNFASRPPNPGQPPLTNTVTLEMQTPFTPSARLAVLSTWQANDPLVHYHVSDLRMGVAATNHQVFFKPNTALITNISPSSLGFLNSRYSPWGGNPQLSSDPNQYDRMVKDAGVYRSDDWTFPTNKLASVGLLGRIHRGTPWQTIYFKSEAAPVMGNAGWTNLSADIAERPTTVPLPYRIFSRTHPTNDWKLADMFTTAIDERTSRGLMSVNQGGLESWSALLSGVVVLSNSFKLPQINTPRDSKYTETIIAPWGSEPFASSPLAIIWTNIYLFQTQTNRGVPLQNVGDILQVPELSVRSPFLNLEPGDPVQRQRNFGVDDFAYEQIPQQILSLLRVGQSRFVIYAYGQALKPAQIDPSSGLVANYQVTAEYATRSVVRVEGDPRSRVRMVVESFNVLPPD